MYSPPKTKAKGTPRRKVATKSSPAGATPASPSKAVQEPIKAAIEPPVDEVQQQPIPSSLNPLPMPSNTEELVKKEAMLYIWDKSNGQFETQGIFMAAILRRTDVPFHYCLIAHNWDHILLAHDIGSDMNAKWTHKMTSITWNHLSSDGQWNSWCLRFASPEDFAEMCNTFVRCSWEALHRTPWTKIKEDEQRYIMSSTEDVEMKDVSEEDEEDEVLDELGVDKGVFADCFLRVCGIHALAVESDEEDDEIQEDEEGGLPMALKGDRNSQLTVGYKGDRSYVVRGKNIGVFSHSNDSGVKYFATIGNIATPKGKAFKPQHVRLMF